MVKKCIVVNNGTSFLQLTACFVKSLNMCKVVCVKNKIGDVLLAIEKNTDCAIIFDSFTFCNELETFCHRVYGKNKKTKLICFCNRICNKYYGLRMYNSGVNCIIEKANQAFDMTKILRKAFTETTLYPQEILEAIEKREHLFMDDYTKKLSTREVEIMFYLSQGLNNKLIAKTLEITSTTVSTTVNRVMKKVGADTKHQAIQKLVQEGVLDDCA